MSKIYEVKQSKVKEEIYGLELNDTLRHDKGRFYGGCSLRNFAHLEQELKLRASIYYKMSFV